MKRQARRKRPRAPERILLLLCAALLLLPPGLVQAGWRTRNGNDYCERGKTPLTGWQVIKGKTYYFSSGGKQYHGWVKVKGSYYFFSQGRKQQGFLLTEGTPGGFSLDQKGRALLPTPGEEERMKAFVYVSRILHRKTKSEWSAKKKLKAMYNYASRLPYRYDDTDKTAAQCVLKFQKQADGDCADTNSFLAFAGAVLGLRSYVINDYAHWWGLVNGRVMDTNFFRFYEPYDKARQGGYSYRSRQAIRVDSPYAGEVMMTVHPDRYAYDTQVLTVFDDSFPTLSFSLQ